ncbi:DUF6442 family protein [Alkalibacterium kapii]|uniref:Uncharacterized protein n=1 Tax=Alkalibacterium kapii TaxID=426704 RepID=A0A511AQA8_9LACT|nr:DUF6442 family protein [Alkalibacterium kapii]GEK90379.1 hypothetical protein AKA01nite_00010 [Alkalibacterium kapii]
MEKDEILERAKKENLFNDEAKNYKAQKGSQWGLGAATIGILIIMIIKYINDKDFIHLFTIYGVYIGFEYLGKYFANKEKTDLISSIGGLLIAIGPCLIWMVNLWSN